MNSDYTEEKGASSFTPSARKSIHSYRDNEMGRYGLNQSLDKNRGNSPTIREQGMDVVDNVMSKMARQTSPLATNKKKRNRRNSYSKDEQNSDDYTYLLSKSLPSTLPSHLYYSDDNEEQNNSRTSASKTRYEDSNLSSDFNRSNLSSDHLEHSPYQRKMSDSSSPVTIQRQSKSNNSCSCIIIVTLLIGIIAVYCSTKLKLLENTHLDKSTRTVIYDQFLFESAMNNLQKKYNIDGNSILKLKSGISTIFSRMDTGSFMFIYNSKTHNFNPTQFEMFIDEVAHTAARYLRNEISSIKHTVVLSTNLDMLEHGELIDRYRDDVDKTGVLLVKEVDSVPSDLAMAFHYYCDEYNPLVKKSAIFFTLDLANCSNVSHKTSIHDFIEKCLSSRWKTVPTENMKPLLTRIVDVIIDLTSAF